MNNWFKSRRGAYFFLLLGLGLMVLFGVLEWRFPRAAQLETATGRVTWSQPARGALRFALERGERFVLYTKADDDGRLRAALMDAAAAAAYPVTVRFDRAQPAQTSIGDFYAVYGVAVGGKEVASLDAVRGSYRKDNLIALAMGVVFAAAGALRLYQDRGRVSSPAASSVVSSAVSSHRAGGGKPAIRRSR
jgi:hypothetical protein